MGFCHWDGSENSHGGCEELRLQACAPCTATPRRPHEEVLVLMNRPEQVRLQNAYGTLKSKVMVSDIRLMLLNNFTLKQKIKENR